MDADKPIMNLVEIRPEEVPTGDSVDERRKRQKLIRLFYKQWYALHPSACAYNKSLNEMIDVAYISVHETSGQASLHYLSTLAVLQLDSILQNAIVVGEAEIKKGNKSQRPFQKMLLMRCCLQGIGFVKLVVGVKRSDNSKVQYCITALQVGEKTKQPQ